MTAPFLYCGGYRAMISCARFRFSSSNSKTVWGELKPEKGNPCARSGCCSRCLGATTLATAYEQDAAPRTTKSDSERRAGDEANARLLEDEATVRRADETRERSEAMTGDVTRGNTR
jgi:hypothetical protein